MPQNTLVQSEETVAKKLLRTKPIWFIEEILGNSLWAKQQQIVRKVARHKRTSVRSCHGAGKTFVAANTAIWFLLAHPDSIVITTAPTFRQVEDVLWREIRQVWAKCRWVDMFTANILTTRLELSEKWYATGVSTDEPDKLQGIHAPHVLVIVDEAAGVEEGIFEAVEGIISSEGAKLLLIGNPTTLAGTFYNSFRDPGYATVHISAKDVPNVRQRRNIIPGLISHDWVQDMRKQWGEDNPIYQARVLGEFPEQGSDTLIPLVKIEAAMRRTITPADNDAVVIGADVARFGSDKTVFVVRKGNKVLEIEKHSSKDTMETVGLLYELMQRHEFPRTYIDEIGVGAGVYDRIREKERVKVTGVNVGEAARDKERFRNKRAELYWKLREKFIEDVIALPHDTELMSQLARIKYKFTSSGILIESKDEMRRRGLSSPDVADALVLAFGHAESVGFHFEVIDDDEDAEYEYYHSDGFRADGSIIPPPPGWMNRIF